MERSVSDIKNRYKIADTHKEQWRSIYEEAYEYALPMRNLYDGYNESGVAGQNKMKRVFDSTAIHSTARFANRIQSSLFPPQRAWCRLQPGNEIPDERKEFPLHFWSSGKSSGAIRLCFPRETQHLQEIREVRFGFVLQRFSHRF